MKKITLLLLLLVTTISFGQTTLANKLKITGNVTSTTYTKINVQEADGIVNTIDKTELTDVIAVASIVNLPVTGVLSKIYITSDTNKIYRWTGTVYQELAVTDITGKVDKNAPITGGTNTKITYDSKGLVTSGTNLIASDIPNIAESQVTNLVSDLALKAPLASPTFTGTVSGITKSMVGLGNVDNTSDINKPVSTAQQTAIDAKVGDFINDGATTIAPSMNAVYDALQLKKNATSTAITSTATLTNNGTTFSLSALTGVIVDNTTVPAGRTVVNFAGATNVTPLHFRTILYINSTGTLIQFNGVTSDLTPQQRVDNLFVGIVVYSGGTVQVVQLIPDIEYSIDNRFSTLGSKIRNINEGNNISANGINLQINKGAGTTWGLGSNFATNREVPDETTDLAQTPIPAGVNLIGYRNGVGGWTYEAFTGSITPTFWDNGSGTKQTVSNNKFTNVRDYFFNGTNTHVFYLGRTEFSTLSAAVSAAEKPDDIVDPATSVGSLIGTISVEKGCTALNNTALAAFTQGPRMQGGASSGGSSGTQSLQSTYLNSSSPHITTTPTLGAVAVRQGSGSDIDNIFVVQNGAGTNTFSVTGAGNIIGGTYNGYTPENVANKSDSYTASSSTTYTSTKALFDGLATKQNTLTNPITGLGTIGMIPFFSSSSNIIDSSIRQTSGFVEVLTKPFRYINDLNNAVGFHGDHFAAFGSGSKSDLVTYVYGSGNKYEIVIDGSIISTFTGASTSFNGNLSASSYTGGATLTGTPTAPTATVGTNTTQIATTAFVQTATRPYKVYTALLTQSGTSAPTVTVLENGLSGSIVWTRISEGLYHGTLTGAFTSDKTAVFTMKQTAGGATDVIRGAQRASSDIVSVMTNTDGVLTGASIEIRVYN